MVYFNLESKWVAIPFSVKESYHSLHSRWVSYTPYIILVAKNVVTDPSMNRCVIGYREKNFMQNSDKDLKIFW